MITKSGSLTAAAKSRSHEARLRNTSLGCFPVFGFVVIFPSQLSTWSPIGLPIVDVAGLATHLHEADYYFITCLQRRQTILDGSLSASRLRTTSRIADPARKAGLHAIMLFYLSVSYGNDAQTNLQSRVMGHFSPHPLQQTLTRSAVFEATSNLASCRQ